MVCHHPLLARPTGRLAMVDGADTFLDLLSGGAHHVTLDLSIDPKETWRELNHLDPTPTATEPVHLRRRPTFSPHVALWRHGVCVWRNARAHLVQGQLTLAFDKAIWRQP